MFLFKLQVSVGYFGKKENPVTEQLHEKTITFLFQSFNRAHQLQIPRGKRGGEKEKKKDLNRNVWKVEINSAVMQMLQMQNK